jgi:hypothetical protein
MADMTAREQYIDIIRKWQAGEQTPELAKEFEKSHRAMLAEAPHSTFDRDIYETVHDINNFLQTERLLKSITPKV